MPNWCYTSYTFVGDKEELNELHGLMKVLEEMDKPLVENGFGTNWLGNIVESLGKSWEKVWCRGSWDNLMLADGTLKFTTETAWSQADEVMDLICEKYPSLSYYFYTEEPGMGIYQTNDDEGRFYPERYYVDLCTADGDYQQEYFNTLDDVIAWIGKKTERVFKTEAEVNVYFDELEEANEDAYCYIHEIEITNN